MATEKRIMSWSECNIEIGKTGENDAMATELKSVGTIKDKSTTLESADGDVLEAKATGGKTVAREQLEGAITLTTRIIEPKYDFLATLLGADHDTSADELKIKTLIVADEYSVKVTPKNTGATGIRIRKSSVVYKEGYSEEEGMYGDLTFTVLECEDKELYTKFKKTA